METFPSHSSNLETETNTITTNGQEHLKEEVKPIVVCLEALEERQDEYHENLGNIIPVNLYSDPIRSRKEGYVKEGDYSYIISPIGNSNPYSDKFYNCTGTVVVGQDKISGESVSFMSHQNPSFFLHEEKEKFLKDFHARLEEMKQKCEEGTIDMVLFGGRYAKVKSYHPGESDASRGIFIKEYLNSIKTLSEEAEKTLGFYPEVIAGPKFSPGGDAFTFDTQNRRLYLKRYSKYPIEFIQSCNSKDIEEVSKTWKPGEWDLSV